mmetsp:Transcript_123013/g.225621  ORF Transcript_123013/g.225621 Transcript_123013/m.225621 type:complete len:287 (+) Transcript_123013:317-1177(+)
MIVWLLCQRTGLQGLLGLPDPQPEILINLHAPHVEERGNLHRASSMNTITITITITRDPLQHMIQRTTITITMRDLPQRMIQRITITITMMVVNTTTTTITRDPPQRMIQRITITITMTVMVIIISISITITKKGSRHARLVRRLHPATYLAYQLQLHHVAVLHRARPEIYRAFHLRHAQAFPGPHRVGTESQHHHHVGTALRQLHRAPRAQRAPCHRARRAVAHRHAHTTILAGAVAIANIGRSPKDSAPSPTFHVKSVTRSIRSGQTLLITKRQLQIQMEVNIG